MSSRTEYNSGSNSTTEKFGVTKVLFAQKQISCCRGAHRKGTSHGFVLISYCGLSPLYKWSANCSTEPSGLLMTLEASDAENTAGPGKPACTLRHVSSGAGSFYFTVHVKTLHDGFYLFECMHIFRLFVCIYQVSLIAQLIKNPPAMQEIPV